MLKTYLITFDAAEMLSLGNELFAFIQNNATTYQFFSPYFGMVLLKSSVDIITVNQTYNAFFDGKSFFIAEITPNLTAGRQSKEVWDWVNDPVPPTLPFRPLGPQ